MNPEFMSEIFSGFTIVLLRKCGARTISHEFMHLVLDRNGLRRTSESWDNMARLERWLGWRGWLFQANPLYGHA